jgi:hypothetical protein
MSSEATIIGVYIGLGLVVFYLLVTALRAKDRPNVNQVIAIMLSAVGGVVGADFGYKVLTATKTFLGQFEEHRLTMILGSIAIVWTSGDELVKIFSPLLPRRSVTIPSPVQSGSPPVEGA